MTPATIAFYATAATIIPVLFLALAVQGRGYENLVKTTVSISQRADQGPSRTAARATAIVLGLIAALILTSAIFGEINAVYALYQQQASSGTAHDVLFSMIVFIIAAVAGPAITLFAGAIPEPPPADTPPGAKAPPETGQNEPSPRPEITRTASRPTHNPEIRAPPS